MREPPSVTAITDLGDDWTFPELFARAAQVRMIAGAGSRENCYINFVRNTKRPRWFLCAIA